MTAIPPLVGMAEIGDLAGGVLKSSVSNWKARFEDFPVPVAELACGDIYLEADARDFLANHPELGGKRSAITEEDRTRLLTLIEGGTTSTRALAALAGTSRHAALKVLAELRAGDSGT